MEIVIRVTPIQYLRTASSQGEINSKSVKAFRKETCMSTAEKYSFLMNSKYRLPTCCTTITKYAKQEWSTKILKSSLDPHAPSIQSLSKYQRKCSNSTNTKNSILRKPFSSLLSSSKGIITSKISIESKSYFMPDSSTPSEPWIKLINFS